MDELVKLVAEKTGMGQEQAKTAVDTVISFLKTKLPEPLAGQLDAMLGNADMMKQAGDVMQNLGGLGGLFGKK
jgi:nucleoid DNA-binding protein